MNSYFDIYSNRNVMVIAEIGVNHDGSFQKAKELVYRAKECGADVVKFQLFTAAKLSHVFTPKVEYQKKTDKHESHFGMLKSLEFDQEKHAKIQEYCKELEISFTTTAYDVSDVEFLTSINVPFIKIASADIVDLPLIAKVAESRLPVIVSTGMATINEIANSVKVLNSNTSDFCLLHCTSEYPTISRHVNMEKISHISTLSGGIFGYSDHTLGGTAALIAMARGARVVEKHFTLNKLDSGPDHLASADPLEFKLYVDNIREAQFMFGSDDFLRTKEEDNMANTSRKSIYLSRNMLKDELISVGDLYLSRPGTGLNGQYIEVVCNKKVVKDLPSGHALSLKDLSND